MIAGATKLTDPGGSIDAVRAYQLVPSGAAQWVGLALPATELVVGGALLLGLLTRGAAAVSGLLLAAFMVGIVSVWARGIEIDCGCFGGGGSRAGAAASYPWDIARDAGLLALSVLVASLGTTRLAVQSALFPTVKESALFPSVKEVV